MARTPPCAISKRVCFRRRYGQIALGGQIDGEVNLNRFMEAQVFLKDMISNVIRIQQSRALPRVFTVTEFDTDGVRFEATNMVERHRIVHHGDETEYTRAMLAALRPDDVLFDIGANVGLVAIHAARLCRTIAFEPDPGFASRLAVNVQLNPDVDVRVLNVAVADKDSTVKLYTDGSGGNSPSLVHQRGEEGVVEVPARSLDSLLANAEVPLPTVLKLDIEGAEILAIQGAAGLFASERTPRALFVEVHDDLLPAFGSSADQVLQLLGDVGYTKLSYSARRAGQQHLILERTS
ncbi:MAG TPA: FkbM family methyltransferase [Gaiellaceae bacterium]